MIKTGGNTTTITCDKCQHSETSPTVIYNQEFAASCWSLNPRAKKYVHRCRFCLTAKERKAMEFVREKFNV